MRRHLSPKVSAPSLANDLPASAGTLTFKAAGMAAADLAELIAHNFRVSILISSDKGGTKVYGVLQEAGLRECLDALAYWCGTRWRVEGGLIYVGGGQVETVAAVPRGLLQDELKQQFGQDIGVVGDKIVVRGEAERVSQITRTLAEVSAVSSKRVRLYAALMTDRQIKAVNRWLATLEAGAKLAVGAAQAGAEAEVEQRLSWEGGASMEALLQLVDDGATASVVSDLDLTLVSGRKITVESGEVDEREINTDVATGGTGTNQARFRTGFDRRTIGLSVEIEAAEVEGRWILHTIVRDSALVDGKERTVSVDGYHWLDDFAVVKIAELNRRDREASREVFDVLPWLKKRQERDEERRLVILAEPHRPGAASWQMAAPPKVEKKPHSRWQFWRKER